jgi:hypothetical protein
MRFYPDIPSRRAATLLSDLVVLVLVLVLALLGLAVHNAVDELAVLGEGVRDAGGSIQGGFDAAADAVDDAPLVGDEVADGLREAGEGSGGNVAELGERGENRVHRLADLLGLLTFLVPASLLLFRVIPQRVAQVRRLTAAHRVLAEPQSPERRRLVAMRAAFSLPYGQLLAHTRDPLGDLAAERYEPLVAAALEDAGLRAKPANG